MMKVMSYNIHGAMDLDNTKALPWENRKKPISTIVQMNNIDLFGLQEPFYEHVKDLERLLPEYRWIGACLEDGKKQGPMNPIFYKDNEFDLLESQFFYLSTTPNIPSKGWGAYFPRGVSVAKFLEKKSNKEFYFFNTHLDYHSRRARDESAKMLRQMIEKIAQTTPYILVGDFNFFSELGGRESYEILTKKNHKPFLLDAMNVAKKGHRGPLGSWSGFEQPGEPGVKPDYVFVSKRGVQVISHSILPDTFKGKYPSDHLPIIAEVELN